MNHPKLFRHLAAAALSALLLTGCTGPQNVTDPAQTSAPPETTQSPTLPEDSALTALAVGDYTVNEVQLDAGGVSNVDCGITLRGDGSCMLYMGWGTWLEGSYEIAGGQLICRCTTLEWDGGGGPGSQETDAVLTFAIREENLLELSDIAVCDPESDNLVAPAAFSVGMTYSIQNP